LKGGAKLKYQQLNKEKGVAGLNVFLALITMLFMIGIIIMVFAIAGARLSESVNDTQTAQLVINDTYTSLADATDWFPTFIVLGALVVLILLVVIIINSIRGAQVGIGGA